MKCQGQKIPFFLKKSVVYLVENKCSVDLCSGTFYLRPRVSRCIWGIDQTFSKVKIKFAENTHCIFRLRKYPLRKGTISLLIVNLDAYLIETHTVGMDTRMDSEALVITIPDAIPVTKAKRRKKVIEQTSETVDTSVPEVTKEPEAVNIEQVAEGLKPFIPYLYKAIGYLQVALLAKKYHNLDKSKLNEILLFDESEIDSLTDPTARVLAKRASFLSKWPDEFSLLIILLTIYQVKLMTLSELNKKKEESRPTTELTVQ